MSYGGYEYGGGFGDGGYGGGGGGFLGNDHMGQAHGGGGFQGGSPGAKVHSRDRQTVMPLTIRQVLSASQSEPDDVYRVDGADIHQIKLVAQIVDVEETATNYIYVVDDSTARTTVKMLANTDPSMYLQEQRAACTKGAYVRIIGQLRDWQGEKTFHAFDVRAIQDPNEITYHLLEAIFAHCFNTKGRPGKGKGGNRGMMQAGFGASLGAPLLGGNMGGMGGMMGADGLTPLQSEVLACFRDGVGDSGEHIKVVERRLAGRVTPEQLRAAVEFLSQEGHLYTTSDEMHFKATS